MRQMGGILVRSFAQSLSARLRATAVALVQIAGLYAVTLACNAVARWLHLPVPGSILGVALVFALLQLGVVKLRWIERGADLLIRELLLFFIPSSVGVMTYAPLMRQDGWKIVAVVVVGTLLVMTVTGGVAEAVWRARNRRPRLEQDPSREASAS